MKNVITQQFTFGKCRLEAETKHQPSLCAAQNADTPSENTVSLLFFSKVFKGLPATIEMRRIIMPKKEKPLTKKERDEKRKAKKAKQSKTQTS